MIDPILEEFKLKVNEHLEQLQLPPGRLRFSPTAEPIDCEIKDFDLIDELGEGSFGEVHKAQHKPTGQMLAIKFQRIMFDPNTKESKEPYMRTQIYQRLLREIIAQSKAQSSYITGYYGMLYHEDRVAFCIELMDFTAETLYYKHKVKQESKKGQNARFDEKALSIVAISILNALLHLRNDLETMHRDIKPRNILINFAGQVKLCDLGVVVFLENSIATSVRGGTLYYSAPEILDSGFQKKYSIKSDVWSLGVVLLEMARFKFPYTTYPEKDFFDDVIDGPVPILNESDGYSQEITTFINKCMVKNPEDRPHIRELEKMELANKFPDPQEMQVYMEEFVKINVK